MSFYCPTVSSNQGKRLEQQMKWLRAVHKTSGDIGRTRPIELTEEVAIPSKQLDSIERMLLDYVGRSGHSMADRLAACGGLLRRLLQACPTPTTADANAKVLQTVLNGAEKADFETLVSEGKADGKASQAGPLYSLYLGQDAPANKLSKIGHFFGVRLFHLGLSKLTSHTLNARASNAQIRALSFDPPVPDEPLLTRYFRDKLATRRYLADDNSILAGFHILVAAYGMLSLLSRLHAAHHGRNAVSTEDLIAAIQAADLLVVEHPSLYHSEISSLLIHRILESPTLCASILARFASSAR